MAYGSGRILLAWEGGAGRGHLVTLKTIAEALGGGFVFDAALCRMEYADEIAPICELAFPGAVLWVNDAARKAAGSPRTASWGEFLGDLNFGDTTFLIRQIGWWVETIKARQSALLIGDFSPTALLGARVAGIPAVAVGTGYSVPPAGMAEFPVLMQEHAIRIFPEPDLLAAVNTALRHFGAAPLERLSDIYAGAVSMPRTIPELDPYFAQRHTPLLPPLNEALPRPDGTGDEVFIYFSTSERDDAALMEAVTSLGVPTRLFMPGIDDALAARCEHAGLIVERAPVPVADIGRRSRLMLHSGQHGSLCMALGMGLVQVAFPQHLEHLYHARRAAELGSVDVAPRGADAATYRSLILAAYGDRPRHAAARELSERLYPSLFGDIHALVRERVLPLLG